MTRLHPDGLPITDTPETEAHGAWTAGYDSLAEMERRARRAEARVVELREELESARNVIDAARSMSISVRKHRPALDDADEFELALEAFERKYGSV